MQLRVTAVKERLPLRALEGDVQHVQRLVLCFKWTNLASSVCPGL